MRVTKTAFNRKVKGKKGGSQLSNSAMNVNT